MPSVSAITTYLPNSRQAIQSVIWMGDSVILIGLVSLPIIYRARLGCVNFNHAASPIEENV
jgi:hypothetical protein